nr:CinA family protein [Nocardioides houyundeii]
MPEYVDLVEQIAEIAGEHELTVAAAESLTGGAITSALAAGPSAATWCRGGGWPTCRR